MYPNKKSKYFVKIECFIVTSVFKTGPDGEPDNFWITIQYGSTGSNIVQ